MSDHVNLKFHLERPGLKLETFNWVELREFMDALLPALSAQPGGPTPRDILPISVTDGSAVPTLRMGRIHLGAVERFREGPTHDWTPEQLQKANNAYTWLRNTGTDLSIGTDELKPVYLPPKAEPVVRHEHTSLYATVLRVGGRRGTVVLKLEDFPNSKACEAPKALLKQIGAHLYERVLVSGRLSVDHTTAELLDFKPTSFRPLGRQSLEDGREALRTLWGDSLNDLDPEQFMRDVRG